MVKVITYGSYDLLHYGHIRLLERAKALGDYLIVGVTSDDYDKTRGKINLQQSLMERVESVKSTGIADEIIVEEYEGQKIDDIRKYNIDIFTVGSDWEGYFDYLNKYCKVIYLPRTEGISSSKIRDMNRFVSLGLIGDARFLNKVWRESKCVNGIHVNALCTKRSSVMNNFALNEIGCISGNVESMVCDVDAAYVRSIPQDHYTQIKMLLNAGKHVLCESPLTLNREQALELIQLSKTKNLILMEAIKTAYSTAYSRLLLILKSGKIGDVISVDAVCTSIKDENEDGEWQCLHEWGPTALLPVFQILGTDYRQCSITSHIRNDGSDSFTKIDIIFDHAVGSIKIGDGVKAEGELIISGSKGYIYVPAPWWNTDYFEVRYEDQSQNKRYFYQLDGEGIRYELVAFSRAIIHGEVMSAIDETVTCKIVEVMERFENRINMTLI